MIPTDFTAPENVDHGISQLIVDGKIKFKSGDPRFSRRSSLEREPSDPPASDGCPGERRPTPEEVAVPPDEQTLLSESLGDHVGATGLCSTFTIGRSEG